MLLCVCLNIVLIGDNGSPAGVSGSTKRSVISMRLVAKGNTDLM